MSIPPEYSFQRYLASKKSVDDRALNVHVLNTLARWLPTLSPAEPLRWLEIGAGIGTMTERLMETGVLQQADYTAIDLSDQNIRLACQRLPLWATQHGYQVLQSGEDHLLSGRGTNVRISLKTADLIDFVASEQEYRQWDVLLAHAFLDLMNVPVVLPQILNLLKDGGLFYFTINFDGMTVLEPQIEPALDAQIQSLYHRTMDDRLIQGQTSGDSRTGRHLFTYLRNYGAEILDAGASDWVVFPQQGKYPADESYFLHFIIHTMDEALRGSSGLDRDQFQSWVNCRHQQVERGELVYIAHQLDIIGRVVRDG
jgi:SAM-dependent methyltransferase